jgi:YbgC/YbaW family acyl-CoA thioester hydrolase
MDHAASAAETHFESREHRLACHVQWGDCDPAGIIFYPTYFRWMDAATWAFMDSVGYSAQRMRSEQLAMPLVSADCQFLAPARHGDRCEVVSRITRVGGASFAIAHQVVGADATVFAKGGETRVWGRFTAGPGSPLKGERIPESVRALFRAG